MNLVQIDFNRVIQAMTGILLLATVALFAYELFKPPGVYATVAGRVEKVSALAAAREASASVYLLPALPARYEHKIIYLARGRKAGGGNWAAQKVSSAQAE